MPQVSPAMIGFLFAALGTGLFSLKSIFIKFAYQQGLDTDSVLMLRMAISLPIYLAILIWLSGQEGRHPTPKFQLIGKIVFLGFIGYFLASWLDLKGLEYITAQLERLTLFTYPIMTALLGAMFFNTPLTRKILFSLVVTYIGLWLVFYQELTLFGDDTVFGTAMVLLSALSYSLYTLIGKPVIHQVGSLWFTSMAMSISSLFVLVYFATFVSFDGLVITAEAWLWVFLLAIFSTVIPSFMIVEAIARIGPAQTGIVGTLGPIVTIFLAVGLLNEPMTIYHIIGVSLVIGGVTVLTWKGKNAKKTEQT